MSKWMSVMMLGGMLALAGVGCNNDKHDDMDSAEPQKMSIDKGAKACPAECDKSAEPKKLSVDSGAKACGTAKCDKSAK